MRYNKYTIIMGEIQMSKLGYIANCIRKMNFKGLFDTVGEVHDISGKNRVFLFCDIVWCGLRYGAGYKDYRLTEWWTLNGKQRKTYVTRTINNSIVKKCNDSAYYHIINNKIDFNTYFSEFMGRKWIYLKEASVEDFREFLDGLEYIIAKPVDESCGRGVEKIKVSDREPEELYSYLTETSRFLCEDYIVQHPVISEIYPSSVNTLRIVTIAGVDHVPHVLYAFIRIGNGGRVVDNINAGGMAAPIDLDTGVINNVAFDKDCNYYDKHPETGKPIVGVQIPLWNEAKELVLKAARKIPQLGYVGWDVAVTLNGPVFVEANHHPGHDILQMPAHTPDKIGMLPKYREYIDI